MLEGNKLVPSLLVPTQGIVCVTGGASSDRGTVFVGTTKGEIVAMKLFTDDLVAKMSSGVPAIEAKLVRLSVEQAGQALPKQLEDGMIWI